MDAVETNTTLQLQANTINTMSEPRRPLANFPPSIWGDRFLSFSLDYSELEAYAKAIEKHKGELRRLIMDPTIYSNAKLHLIYYVYRLGLTYLFKEEINRQVDKLFTEFDLQDYNEVDLITVAIHFQVFRIHGYKMSSDVFNKFKDGSSGTFKEEIIDDVRGMLSLYESAQLRIRGEGILDEAFTFAQSKLTSVEKTLEGNLARQVEHALERPFHRGIPMVEARLYLVNYEEECSTYDSLLKLAKAHFNYLQLLQKEELRIVTKWWKDNNFQVLFPYVRDRVPELYMWMLALFTEPYYSQARIITTKIVIFILVLDDTCDAYATIEEIRLLIHAIDKWEVSATEQLPEYIRPFYEILLKEYADLDKQLAKEGRAYVVNASKQAFQNIARAYLQEAEWRHNQEVPSFEEYLKIGLTTSTTEVLSKSALIGMGKIVTQEAIDWFESHPKIMIASESIGRLHDDVMTFQFERERDVVVTSVETYMKTFGVSESIAIDEINKMIDDAWKVLNEGCLKPRDVEMDLLVPIVNLARTIDVAYKYDDGFTFPEKTLKEYIILVLQASVPM